MRALVVAFFVILLGSEAVIAGDVEQPAGQDVKLTSKQIELIGLKTAVASEGVLTRDIWLNGEVTADQDRTLQIMPKAGGVIVELKKTLGDDVRANDTLALIESQDIPAAWATYDVARSKADLADNQFARNETLWNKKVIAEEDYLVSKQGATEAQAQLKAAVQKLALFGIDPTKMPEMASANFTSSRVPVTAPMTGTIVEKKIAIGDQVTEQSPLFRLANLDKVWVIANAFEPDMASLKVGLQASVKLRAYPQRTFEGTITWVSQVLDEKTRTLAVRVELDNQERLLKPGSFARVLVLVPEKSTSLSVPPAAVQRQDKDQIVFVDEGSGVYKRRVVKTALQAPGAIEIVQGLKAGERVVTEGSFVLKSELEKSNFGED
ncbi:efflux RND transporter periplasmic adaptor subunit [Hyphomicrobium sp.]|uniref:efflux RND transporter periplasmic adaptor subunit n=1 Tax=Hyphomicrobium sp. TaxID=82 RepID=UPI0025C636B8|nr:efflux RND transporter periplasmic adaptor subunit [Hyphomicrobium sp.]